MATSSSTSSYRKRFRKKVKSKLTRNNIEWVVYILLIVGLVVYGLKNTEAAVQLIQAVKDAFSILLLN